MRQLAHWLWRLRRKRSEKRVRKKGLEPLRPFGHQLLRLARLPIPPLPRWNHEYNIAASSVNASDRQCRTRFRVRLSLAFASTSLLDLSLAARASVRMVGPPGFDRIFSAFLAFGPLVPFPSILATTARCFLCACGGPVLLLG